jgi:DNA-binding transcriptional ArsR family regulator
VRLEERWPGPADFLQGIASSHAHDLVVTLDDAVDQLVQTLGLGQNDGHHHVDVAQRARVAATQLRTERSGPVAAAVAALMGDQARCAMLTALLDGSARPAGELARAAGGSAPTASGHLGRLLDAGLLSVQASGRHRYFALSGPPVAAALEALAQIAPTVAVRSLRQSRTASALAEARSCYDHLAGRAGMTLRARRCSTRVCCSRPTAGITPHRPGACPARRSGRERRSHPALTPGAGPRLPGLVRTPTAPRRRATGRTTRSVPRTRLADPPPQ